MTQNKLFENENKMFLLLLLFMWILFQIIWTKCQINIDDHGRLTVLSYIYGYVIF